MSKEDLAVLEKVYKVLGTIKVSGKSEVESMCFIYQSIEDIWKKYKEIEGKVND